ncbi:hypothetical protein Patl1_06322 [Pistacia atlantica]|uniref:Uncharacterized protein n=1 Tax=Pistacia atlantica TaxID=434234 RepID=A0ACC1BQB1_9ROSI|nr:hypothetical protein Patl1_06322 [Pistacia atlantica]
MGSVGHFGFTLASVHLCLVLCIAFMNSHVTRAISKLAECRGIFVVSGSERNWKRNNNS